MNFSNLVHQNEFSGFILIIMQYKYGMSSQKPGQEQLTNEFPSPRYRVLLRSPANPDFNGSGWTMLGEI